MHGLQRPTRAKKVRCIGRNGLLGPKKGVAPAATAFSGRKSTMRGP